MDQLLHILWEDRHILVKKYKEHFLSICLLLSLFLPAQIHPFYALVFCFSSPISTLALSANDMRCKICVAANYMESCSHCIHLIPNTMGQLTSAMLAIPARVPSFLANTPHFNVGAAAFV